jgi:uncharacterized membrane protein
MTMTHALSSPARAGTRWLLIGSLALNLFFIGIAVAMMVRTPAPRWDRNIFVRVERMAATLPQADAAVVRNAMKTHHDAIDSAQTGYLTARNAIRDALREEPFKVEDIRAAMARSRAARQHYDQIVHGVFADIAQQVSAEARQGMADWRSPRRKPQGDRR